MVEADGLTHAGADAEAYDAARDAWMEARGFTVLRFPDAAVLSEPDLVLQAVAHAAAQRRFV